jgi:DNA-binding transcriptional LysR family regulator
LTAAGGHAPTEAGERLLQTVGPRFEEIAPELAAVRNLRDKPAGIIRITTIYPFNYQALYNFSKSITLTASTGHWFSMFFV